MTLKKKNTDEEISKHDVRYDTVGLNARPRYTCYTPTCAGATLVFPIDATYERRNKMLEEFLEKHPCPPEKIVNEGWRG